MKKLFVFAMVLGSLVAHAEDKTCGKIDLVKITENAGGPVDKVDLSLKTYRDGKKDYTFNSNGMGAALVAAQNSDKTVCVLEDSKTQEKTLSFK